MFSKIVKIVRERYNDSKGFIPLHAPVFGGNEKKYLNECIDSTFVSSVGKFVNDFEECVAEYTGAKKAVVCVNGTNALQLSLQLVGVNQGDEVISQPLTFVATANAISYLGAKPLWVDVNKETMGLCPSALKVFLEDTAEVINGVCINKKTKNVIKACVPMHTFGHACKIDEIAEICEAYHIKLVEDAAESLGSYYKDKHTGTFGDIGVISFNGNKILTTGGGGIMLFNDEVLAEKAKYLSTTAKVPHAWEFFHDDIGYNYRMPNLNAALGLAQLEQIDGFLKSKRETASFYAESIKNMDGVQFFEEPINCTSNYWLNAIVFENKELRNSFLEHTNSNGVMTRPIWALMTTLPMFENCIKGNLSNAEWLVDRVVNIPSSVI